MKSSKACDFNVKGNEFVENNVVDKQKVWVAMGDAN